MKSNDIRKKFFDFFVIREHEIVSSSSLIPAQDPTLLFANAGMNQFKDVFLGKEKRSYARATTIQKCMRAGGKHNDLNNVGFTRRHLTFFEMMGNFSFGDYFKKDAIIYAWDFLTQEMNLPTEKLHATVFETDDETYELWHKTIGLPKEKIHSLGAKDNFWQMGDTGPCGPCTEIHIDQGKQNGCGDKNCGPACDCDRFLEIWNLVFMQFDRQPDGTDLPLKQTGVDTGMGLERLCCIAQKKLSVFETDLFTSIIEQIELLTKHIYNKQNADRKAAFHVIADHIRAATLLISDDCAPSNDGRGYVLRKIIRRAALFNQKLTDKNIFPELVPAVVRTLINVYPNLKTNEPFIQKTLESEVEKFSANLTRGQNILLDCFKKNKKNKLITGPQAFKLYDTFGFPLELTTLIAQEKGYAVDVDGFEKEMKKQQIQSTKTETTDGSENIKFCKGISTEFTGYQELETTSEIIAMIKDSKVVGQIAAGKTCWIITKKSPFFIIGGGQEPDHGWIKIRKTKTKLLDIKFFNNAIGVKIKTPVNLKCGDLVTSIVDTQHRLDTMKNHTATHLMQAALTELFGKQIKQAGSLVCPDYMRFDFTYHENLTLEQIKQVEDLVNQKIMENTEVKIKYSTYKDAVKYGVKAFSDNKYNPERVRIVEIPGFSSELCGGTHIQRTGDIGCFKITEVSALSAGHRRIFAVTGPKAIQLFQESFGTIKKLSQGLKVPKENVLEIVEKLKEQLNLLQYQIKQLKKQAIKSNLSIWEEKVANINKIPFLFVLLENYSFDEIKDIGNFLLAKKPGFYFIISNTNDKSTFLAIMSKEFSTKIDMIKFSNFIKVKCQLRSGGSSTMLQGGGPTIVKNLESEIINWIKSQ